MSGIAQLAIRGPLYAGGIAALLMLGSILPVRFLGAFGVFVSMVFLIGSSAVIALSILRHGTAGGFRALGAATGALCIATIVTGAGVQQGLLLALMFWLPVALGATVLRETVSLSFSLIAITLLALLAVAVVYLVLGDPAASWKSILSDWTQQMQGAFETMGGDATGGAGQVDLSGFVDVMSKMMTGAMAATMFWLSCIALLLARSWQARLFNPGGFQQEFHAIQAGKTAAGVGAAVCIGAVLTSMNVLTSLATVVIAAFFFQGLAVVHALVKSRGMSQGWLVGLYAMLMLVQTTILLGALGMADNWLNMRKI